MPQRPGIQPRLRHGEVVASGMAEDKQTFLGEEVRQVNIIEQTLGAGGGTLTRIPFSKRRVGKDEVKVLSKRGQLCQSGEGILYADLKSRFRQAGLLQALANDVAVSRGFLDTKDGNSTATQALQAQRPGAGKQFQDSCPLDPWAEPIKERLTNPIGGRANLQTLGDPKHPPPRCAAGDAHAASQRAMDMERSRRRDPLPAGGRREFRTSDGLQAL